MADDNKFSNNLPTQQQHVPLYELTEAIRSLSGRIVQAQASIAMIQTPANELRPVTVGWLISALDNRKIENARYLLETVVDKIDKEFQKTVGEPFVTFDPTTIYTEWAKSDSLEMRINTGNSLLGLALALYQAPDERISTETLRQHLMGYLDMAPQVPTIEEAGERSGLKLHDVSNITKLTPDLARSLLEYTLLAVKASQCITEDMRGEQFDEVVQKYNLIGSTLTRFFLADPESKVVTIQEHLELLTDLISFKRPSKASRNVQNFPKIELIDCRIGTANPSGSWSSYGDTETDFITNLVTTLRQKLLENPNTTIHVDPNQPRYMNYVDVLDMFDFPGDNQGTIRESEKLLAKLAKYLVRAA